MRDDVEENLEDDFALGCVGVVDEPVEKSGPAEVFNLVCRQSVCYHHFFRVVLLFEITNVYIQHGSPSRSPSNAIDLRVLFAVHLPSKYDITILSV